MSNHNFYNSEKWRKKSRYIYLRDNGICQICGQYVEYKQVGNHFRISGVVDHIIELTPSNMTNYDVAWNDNNLRLLCHACHNKRHARSPRKSKVTRKGLTFNIDGELELSYSPENSEFYPNYLEPSLVPLTIISGPPGSGKTTYANSLKGENDLVIDLDEIRAKISGKGWYQSNVEWLLPAIHVRNKMLLDLGSYKDYNHCYFIASAPKKWQRDFWREKLKPVKVVVLEVPADECIRRIHNDERRSKADVTPVIKWWKEYEKDSRDEVIKDTPLPQK